MDVNDTENTENKVSDKSTESANSTAESTEASKNDSKASKPESCLGAFKKRYNEIRNKKLLLEDLRSLSYFVLLPLLFLQATLKQVTIVARRLHYYIITRMLMSLRLSKVILIMVCAGV